MMLSIILASVAIVTIRSVNAQNLGDLPSCAQVAASAGIIQTGCAITDIQCICKASAFLRSLLQQQCNEADQRATYAFATQLCQIAGVELPASLTDLVVLTTPTTTTEAVPSETPSETPLETSAEEAVSSSSTPIVTTTITASDTVVTSLITETVSTTPIPIPITASSSSDTSSTTSPLDVVSSSDFASVTSFSSSSVEPVTLSGGSLTLSTPLPTITSIPTAVLPLVPTTIPTTPIAPNTSFSLSMSAPIIPIAPLPTSNFTGGIGTVKTTGLPIPFKGGSGATATGRNWVRLLMAAIASTGALFCML